ncbi:hypothetical protein ACI48J_23635 [Paenibacillus chitinolyticus]
MTEIIKGIIPLISNLLLAVGHFFLQKKIDKTKWKVPQREENMN